MDEEHESSYKQQDPAPRYHARSAAIIMARLFAAKVLLGTATPSIETYHNALTSKYGLVQMQERYQGLQLPRITMIDLQRQYHRKEMYGHFSVANKSSCFRTVAAMHHSCNAPSAARYRVA